jgi:hypothetical protein
MLLPLLHLTLASLLQFQIHGDSIVRDLHQWQLTAPMFVWGAALSSRPTTSSLHVHLQCQAQPTPLRPAHKVSWEYLKEITPSPRLAPQFPALATFSCLIYANQVPIPPQGWIWFLEAVLRPLPAHHIPVVFV